MTTLLLLSLMNKEESDSFSFEMKRQRDVSDKELERKIIRLEKENARLE